MTSRFKAWIAALLALVGTGSLAACALSPAAGVWGIGLFLASVFLFHVSARAAPGTSTHTDIATDTDTSTVTDSTSAPATSTDTDTTSDLGTSYTGVCLSMPAPSNDGCSGCSIEETARGLVFLTPGLLVLARRRRRRDVLDRLAAHRALPDDVLDRLRDHT